MATVPGTYFTKEQLEADRKVDNVSDGKYSGSNKLTTFGFVYKTEQKQYDKALAWYLLAARENDSAAYNNIGALYFDGLAVPKNYLCALKWFLKSAEGNGDGNTPTYIGWLFENGYGVPLDKYKALEWYCHGGDKSYIKTLKDQGYHRSETDKKKSLQQLIKEAEAILDSEKKKLEEKQDRTQQEMEALVDVEITYNLVDGGKNAWKDVPILFADDRQRYTKPVNNSDEILELKKQIQLLKQDKNTIESPANQIESLKQEKADLELQIKEKDKELVSLRNDNQSLQRGNSTVQQGMKTKDSKINSLQSENQELKLKIISFQTESQSLKHRIDECEQQINAKVDEFNLLKEEHCSCRASSIQQNLVINSLKQEEQTKEQERKNIINETERLKSSYSTLEQLLKSKEDTIVSLNRENKMLSTINQGNQQGANTMAETFQNLLQGKTNEIELLKQNMEHLLADERRRNDALELEIRALKQERTQQQATVQNTDPSNNDINSTNSNPTQYEQHDDSYNDLNYESEYSDIEESNGDDINYDTPSEDEDSNNDLNYDDANESNK